MSGWNLPPGVTADMIPGNEPTRGRVRRGHKWTGPTQVLKYVHCSRCEEIKQIDPAKPNTAACPGRRHNDAKERLP